MRAWRVWGKTDQEGERPEMPEQKEVDEAFDVFISNLETINKIRAEIERLKERYAVYQDKFKVDDVDLSIFYEGKWKMCDEVLALLDTLQEQEPKKTVNVYLLKDEWEANQKFRKEREKYFPLATPREQEPQGLDEVAKEYASDDLMQANLEIPAFKAGAEYQYQKDRYEFAKIKAKIWEEGYDAGAKFELKHCAKLKELADNMYSAAQYLTTDASRLHKAMEEYKHYVNFEMNK